jgi:hypothetical protein
MTFVVLLDQKAPDKDVVQNRLTENGLVTWRANDVQHAIEELSDFTVRDRPDVVLVEVAFLEDSFDTVRSALTKSTAGGDVTVLGMGTGSGNELFARDLEQLNELMMQCTSN